MRSSSDAELVLTAFMFATHQQAAPRTTCPRARRAELVLTAFVFATATNKRDYELVNFPKDVEHKVIKDVEQAKLPLGQGLVQKSILAFNRAATVPTRSSREGVQGPKGMDPNHHKAAIAEHAMGVHKLLTKTGTGNLAAFQPNLRTNLALLRVLVSADQMETVEAKFVDLFYDLGLFGGNPTALQAGIDQRPAGTEIGGLRESVFTCVVFGYARWGPPGLYKAREWLQLMCNEGVVVDGLVANAFVDASLNPPKGRFVAPFV
ncbi:hypothetical protein TeGR_g457, partial [Tetraparma gracilis]